MKLVRGADIVLRGAVPVTANNRGFTKRINFFDGDYKHGYRVTKFMIGTDAANGGADCIGKLSSAEPADPTDAFWNWANTQEFAWTSFEMLSTVTPSRGEPWTLVARDNLIIEDLYITVRTRDEASPEVFYYIELEKYELPAYRGTQAIVENMSQG